MTEPLPRIGFDRYVELDWCRGALHVAAGRITLDDLKDTVANSLTGTESRRKSVDILKRFWLNPFPDTADFLQRGIRLFNQQGESAVLPLTWGAAISTYPFFGKTAEITGRLFRLHSDCTINEVQRRIAEIYGDRNGVSRAVSRVLQSQEKWGVIERIDKKKRITPLAPVIVDDEELTAWLIEAAIRYAGKPLAVQSLQMLPVLFPFIMTSPLAYAASNSPYLELRSEGPSQQFVALCENK